jgi:hypothetical protein
MPSSSAWLESMHTANDITFWIIQCLTECHILEPFSAVYTDMPGLLQAITAQDGMGWLAFFRVAQRFN